MLERRMESLESDRQFQGEKQNECAALKEGTAMWQRVDKKYGLI